MIHWQWRSFEQLSLQQLYQILRARQEVFTVEQDCAYQDADCLDQYSWHLMGWCSAPQGQELAAYLRVVFPEKKYPEPSIGRVLTRASHRGTGLGRELMRRAIECTGREYPDRPIRISAQQHLQRFYSEFGFEKVSEPYEEDGIPHIEMLRKPL
ncbi:MULTISPECIES: GNAT family N-acetyltransferase [unclassified Microbulbifer]|uniref:GNAT family N-acetyltransferase n=1 Tax=unclassified Microbulbifer TaxID=2619833 RepID=UPI0027E58EDE|nr:MULTISPECIES: GNAT family N-acetyltransferase [unclassified Microbulbifer]